MRISAHTGTLCLVRAPRSSADGALRIIRHELEVAVRVGWAEIGVFGLSRLPVARPNKPHPMCGFDEILLARQCPGSKIGSARLANFAA
jgi:hypothetical protein